MPRYVTQYVPGAEQKGVEFIFHEKKNWSKAV